MFRGAAVFLATLALALCVQATDVEIVRVWPGWRDAASFKRISEYFTGKETDGGRVVRRTRPAHRAGFYFLVRLRHPGIDLGSAKFALQVVAPDSPEPRRYEFPAGVGPGTHVFELGLTGPDWEDKGAQPVAWRLELLSAAGAVLASAQSYLWSQP